MARVVFFLFGCTLLTSAFAKMWSLAFDPFSDIQAGIPKKAIVCLVGLEFFLAWLNVCKASKRSSTLAIVLAADMIAVVCFLAFSAHRWLSGHELCGCFGSVQLPVQFTMTLNMLAFTWFVSQVISFFGLAEGV